MKENIPRQWRIAFWVMSWLLFLCFGACSETSVEIQERVWEELGSIRPEKTTTLCSKSGVCLTFLKGSSAQMRQVKLRKIQPSEFQVSEKQRENIVGSIFEFRSSRAKFQKEFEVKFPLNVSVKTSTLQIVFWQKDHWVPVPSRVTPDRKYVIGLSDHFSIWTIKASCPQKYHTQCDELKSGGERWLYCVNTGSDVGHCGKCTNKCSSEQSCMGGECCTKCRYVSTTLRQVLS